MKYVVEIECDTCRPIPSPNENTLSDRLRVPTVRA